MTAAVWKDIGDCTIGNGSLLRQPIRARIWGTCRKTGRTIHGWIHDARPVVTLATSAEEAAGAEDFRPHATLEAAVGAGCHIEWNE